MSEPKEKRLVVLLNGARMGTLDQDAHGQLSFTYGEDYRRRRSPTPLSLSMPIARRTHGNETVEPYLRGLLPDNENVLAQILPSDGTSDMTFLAEGPHRHQLLYASMS